MIRLTLALLGLLACNSGAWAQLARSSLSGTVKAGATIRITWKGDAEVKTCEFFPPPTFEEIKAPTLGKLFTKEREDTITYNTSGTQGSCEGKKGKVIEIYYAAGRATGKDTFEFYLKRRWYVEHYVVTVRVE